MLNTTKHHNKPDGEAAEVAAYTAYVHRARVDFRARVLNLEGLEKLEGWSHDYKKSERYEHGVHILRKGKTTITIFRNTTGDYTLQVVSTSLEEARRAFEEVALITESFEYEEIPRYLELFIRYHESKEKAVCEALEALGDIYGEKQSIVYKWHEGKRVAYVNRVSAQLSGYVVHAKSYRHKNWRAESGARRHPKLEVVVYFKGKEVERGLEVAKRVLATLAHFARLSKSELLESGEEGLEEVLCLSDSELLRLLYARYGRSVVEKIARRPLESRKEQLLFLLRQGFNLTTAAKLMRISARHARRIARLCKEEGLLERKGRKWIVRTKPKPKPQQEEEEEEKVIHVEATEESALKALMSQITIERVYGRRIIARLNGEKLQLRFNKPPMLIYTCEKCGRQALISADRAEFLLNQPLYHMCGGRLEKLERIVLIRG